LRSESSAVSAHERKLSSFNEMRFVEDDLEEKILFQSWGSFFILEKNKEFEAGSKFYANTEFSEQ